MDTYRIVPAKGATLVVIGVLAPFHDNGGVGSAPWGRQAGGGYDVEVVEVGGVVGVGIVEVVVDTGPVVVVVPEPEPAGAPMAGGVVVVGVVVVGGRGAAGTMEGAAGCTARVVGVEVAAVVPDPDAAVAGFGPVVSTTGVVTRP